MLWVLAISATSAGGEVIGSLVAGVRAKLVVRITENRSDGFLHEAMLLHSVWNSQCASSDKHRRTPTFRITHHDRAAGLSRFRIYQGGFNLTRKFPFLLESGRGCMRFRYLIGHRPLPSVRASTSLIEDGHFSQGGLNS